MNISVDFIADGHPIYPSTLGKVEILVQSKLSAVTSPGRQIELMAIVFKVPDYVASVKMVASFGQVHFDQSSKVKYTYIYDLLLISSNFFRFIIKKASSMECREIDA